MRSSRREPWKLSYKQQKHVSQKYRSIQRKIIECKQLEDWDCVKRLKYLIRHSWWGVKRYKKD
jgi:hypothetical protein